MPGTPDPGKTLKANFAALHQRLDQIDATLKTVVKDADFQAANSDAKAANADLKAAVSQLDANFKQLNADFKASFKQVLDRLPPQP